MLSKHDSRLNKFMEIALVFDFICDSIMPIKIVEFALLTFLVALSLYNNIQLPDNFNIYYLFIVSAGILGHPQHSG